MTDIHLLETTPKMTDFQTTAPLFIAIITLYTVCSLFFFGAHKAFFQPFEDKGKGEAEE